MSSTQPQPAINAIPYSPEYWERLKSLVHSVEELKKDGYKLEPLDSKAIQRLRRCRNCHCEPSMPTSFLFPATAYPSLCHVVSI